MRKCSWITIICLCAVVSATQAADLTGDLGLSGRATNATRNLRSRQASGGGGAAGRATGSVGRSGGLRARTDLQTRGGANVDSRGIGVGAGVHAESSVGIGRGPQGEEPSTNPGAGEGTNPNQGSRRGIANANLILRHRLAEIDHMRDLALEYGDETLLQRADQFENRVRAEHQQQLRAVAQESATEAAAAGSYAGRAEGAANFPPPQRVQGRLEAYGQQAFENRPQAPQAPTYDGYPNVQGQARGRLEFADRVGPTTPRAPQNMRPEPQAYGNAYGDAYGQGGYGIGPAQGEFQSAAQGAAEFERRGQGLRENDVRSAAGYDGELNARNRVWPAGRDAYGQGAIDVESYNGAANRVNQAALQQRGTASGDVQFRGPQGFDVGGGAQTGQQFYYGPPRYYEEPRPAPPSETAPAGEGG